MSDFIRIFCRSSRLITLPEIVGFIEEGAYFEEPRFDPMPGNGESDWQRLIVFYQPKMRPIVLYKNAGDPLMHEEIAETSTKIAGAEILRRLQETTQTIAIEINSSALTEEAWEMLDSLEAYLAQTCDGIVFVDGEGFYNAALQKIDEE